jgi:hypothetical protein
MYSPLSCLTHKGMVVMLSTYFYALLYICNDLNHSNVQLMRPVLFSRVGNMQ